MTVVVRMIWIKPQLYIFTMPLSKQVTCSQVVEHLSSKLVFGEKVAVKTLIAQSAVCFDKLDRCEYLSCLAEVTDLERRVALFLFVLIFCFDSLRTFP